MVSIVVKAWLKPRRIVHAHCDLPCGVYDPAQARIEAESVKALQEKYQGSDDAIFKETRALLKELRESVEDLREQAPINSFIGVVFSAF